MSYYKHIKEAVENNLLSDRQTPKLAYKECYKMFQEIRQEKIQEVLNQINMGLSIKCIKENLEKELKGG